MERQNAAMHFELDLCISVITAIQTQVYSYLSHDESICGRTPSP
jgi:hypothetical protein